MSHELPDPHMRPADLDVVIVNYRTPNLLERCLDSWEKYASPDVTVNIIVVDVDPEPPISSGRRMGDRDKITYLRVPYNIGYGGACNLAARLCAAPIISFWNADTALINADAIPTMIQHFADVPECGIAGPKSIDTTTTPPVVTHAGILNSHMQPYLRGFRETDQGQFTEVLRAISVSGSAYFVRRAALDRLARCDLYRDTIAPHALGAFLDTPHYFEETWISYHAFAHRIQVWYVGTAVVEHLWNRAPDPGVSTSQLFAMSQPIFRRACDLHGLEHD